MYFTGERRVETGSFGVLMQRSDAAGRTLRSLDQLDNVTVYSYDAGGNQLSVRDPNNVGTNMVYELKDRLLAKQKVLTILLACRQYSCAGMG